MAERPQRDAVTGGFYTGENSSDNPLNKPFWASLYSYKANQSGLNDLYGWTEVTPVAGGWVDVPGGRYGTPYVRPVQEAAGTVLGVGGGSTSNLDNRVYVQIQRSYYDPVLDWVYRIVAHTAPVWQYFKVTGCPDGTGLYYGDIVLWDGTAETTLEQGVRGVHVNYALSVGKRYVARLTPLTTKTPTTTSTTTTGTGTTTSTTTTSTTSTTTLAPCRFTTTSTTTTTPGPGTTTTTSTTTTTWGPTTSTTLPPSVWACENDSAESGACGSPTPSYNTTPTPNAPGVTVVTSSCAGTCEWLWNQLTLAWDKTCQSCNAGCYCPPPNFCGTGTECASTSCFGGGASLAPPCCGGTTTTAAPTTSTSTTTPGPGTTTTTSTTTTVGPPGSCSSYCSWIAADNSGTWSKTFDGCASTCPCPSPTGTGTACISTQITQCVSPVLTTPVPCSGACSWYAAPPSGNWTVPTAASGTAPGRCSGGTSNCGCMPPSQPGVPCTFAYTPCFEASGGILPGGGTTTANPGTTGTAPPVGPTTTTSTTCAPTTTGAPGSCIGMCTWTCNGAGTWTVLRTDPGCQGCACPFPPSIYCVNNCQVYQSPCGTTTSTTTTTTSSTTSGPCGNCAYVWTAGSQSSYWALNTYGCTGSCNCVQPNYVGQTVGEVASPNCEVTTTTAAPCNCAVFDGETLTIGLTAGAIACSGVATANSDGCAGQSPCSVVIACPGCPDLSGTWRVSCVDVGGAVTLQVLAPSGMTVVCKGNASTGQIPAGCTLPTGFSGVFTGGICCGGSNVYATLIIS